jgi:hypothetical protein
VLQLSVDAVRRQYQNGKSLIDFLWFRQQFWRGRREILGDKILEVGGDKTVEDQGPSFNKPLRRETTRETSRLKLAFANRTSELSNLPLPLRRTAFFKDE